MRLWKLLAVGVVWAGLGAAGAAAAEGASAGKGLPTTEPSGSWIGNTIPSKRAQINVKASEPVREVLVKPGQTVNEGDVLMKLDDREEQARLKIIQAEADTAEVAIRAAEAMLKYKEIEQKRFEDMKEAAQWAELAKARQEAVQAALDVEAKKKELAAKQSQIEYQKTVIERLKITSPWKGIVEEVNLREGELPDPNKPPVVVVQTDPLWVKVNLPSWLAQAMHERMNQNTLREKQGQPPLPLPDVRVEYADRPGVMIPAKVIYFNPVADPASQTQPIRLELANGENRDAGLRVKVYVGAMPAVEKGATDVARSGN